MKKVLHILPCLSMGGTEAYVMTNYRNVQPEQVHFDFAVFSLQASFYLQEIETRGGKVVSLGQPSMKSFVKFYKNFKHAVKNGDGSYDAIHCHADIGSAIPLLCGALCGIKKRIAHSHAVNRSPRRLVGRIAYGFRKVLVKLFATDYFACSSIAGESLFGKRRFQKKGIVCNNGIDVNKFVYADEHNVEILRKEVGLTKEYDLVVGNISRFDDNKNQTFILDVFSHLLKKYPRAILLLGGNDGGKLDAIKNKVSALGMEENVRFIGIRQDVSDCLQLIDVYLFPSKNEGLGIGLLEAQAANCLCFASTGVPEAADLQMGNVTRIPLENGAQYWADAISTQLVNRKTISADAIQAAFRQKGFDIQGCAAALVRRYE